MNKQEKATNLIKEGLLELKKMYFNEDTNTEEDKEKVENLDGVEVKDTEGNTFYSSGELKENVEVYSIAPDGAKIPLIEGDILIEGDKKISVSINEEGLSIVSKIEDVKPTEDAPTDEVKAEDEEKKEEEDEVKAEDEVKKEDEEEEEKVELRIEKLENSMIEILNIMKSISETQASQNKEIVSFSKALKSPVKDEKKEVKISLSSDKSLDKNMEYIKSLQESMKK